MRSVQTKRSWLRWMAIGGLLPLALAAGCGKGKEAEAAGEVDATWMPAALAEVDGVPAANIRSAIAQRLGAARPDGLDDDQWRHVQRLYKRFGGSPLWLDKGGLDRSRVKAMTDALLKATNDALRVEAYPIGPIAQALVDVEQAKNPTAEQFATADVLLTSAYAALGEDLLTGQINPRQVSQDWHIDPQEENVDSALVRGLRTEPLDISIAKMRPQDADYAALQRELAHYRDLAAKGGWPTVPEGRELKPGDGDSPARLTALRNRLAAEGFHVGAAPAPVPADTAARRRAATRGDAVYDRTLAGAVAEYQSRHAINADSILGAETVESLNLSAAYRAQVIAANLERFRWLPRALGRKYILVNVPAFRLEAFDQGKPALEMKVVVGAEYEDRKTPVFSDSMQFVVFRPYWNVTPDIQAKELEPKIAADPGYMERNDYEYFQDGGQTRIRQRPGPKNSLGLVKFLFPNDFNIYLHDTPEDKLFEKDVRAYSHGCIRLEKPVQLAEWVLGWPADRIQQAMNEGPNNRTVTVPKPIPVYIAYFTAYIQDGQLHFGNDLYDRDAALAKMVAEGAQPSARAMQAIEALRRIAAKS